MKDVHIKGEFRFYVGDQLIGIANECRFIHTPSSASTPIGNTLVKSECLDIETLDIDDLLAESLTRSPLDSEPWQSIIDRAAMIP